MKNGVQIIMLLLCLIFKQWISLSQTSNFRFEHFTTNDRLSNNVISNIYKDARGYIWLVTPSGLNRFDGSQFQILPSEENNPKNAVFSVQTFLTDSYKNFWMGGYNTGLVKYSYNEREIISYKTQYYKELHSNTITCILESADKNLWIGTFEGLNKFDIRKKQFTKIANPSTLRSFTISTIIADSNNTLWILVRNSLYSFSTFSNTYKFHCRVNFLATVLLEIEPGKFWIGGEGFDIYDSKTERSDVNEANKFRHVWEKSPILDFCRTKSGDIWIGTDGSGLYIYNLHKKSFSNLRTDDFDKNSLSTNAIYKIYEDNEGIIWIGTVRGGLNKWAPNKWKFKHYYNNPLKKNTLSNNIVNAFVEDSAGFIWLGTAGGGLNKFNPRNEEFSVFKHDENNPYSLSNDVVTGIIEDRNKNLWIATYSNGINLFDQKQNRFIRFNTEGRGRYHFPVNSFLGICESDGYIYIASHGGGIIKMNIETYEYESFVNDPKTPSSLCGNYVADVCADRDGNIWVATSDGLDFLSKNSTRFEHFKYIENDSTTISNSIVNTVKEDRDNNIWVGTSMGLSCLNPITKKCRRFTLADGLPDLMIFGILQDNAGDIWVTTNNGICRFQPQTGKFKVFDKSDGLQDKQFNQGALKTKNGELYFGGVNGFNRFNPKEITEKQGFPKAIINDLKLYNISVKPGKDADGRQILENEISETNKIKLNYTDWVFSLEFTALEFGSPEKIQYAYKLEYFDTRWNYTTSIRKFATYTNLNPGDYIFRLKTTNSDGNWNTEETTLKIKIIPPFWLTWWFKSLVGLLITSLALRFYFRRINTIKRQKLVLENKVKERAVQLTKAHSKLEESNTRFKKLFEYANDAIFILNMDNFNIEMMNMKAKEIPDFSKVEDLNFCDFSGMAPQLLMQKFLEGAIFETRIELENNNILVLEISTQTFTETDKPLGLLICRDITERMKILEKMIVQKELIVNQQNEIAKLDFEKSKIENAKLNIELDSQKREIASKTIALLHQNEMINKLIKRLDSFKMENEINRRNISIMISELKQQQNHNIWKEFIFRFEQVDPGFYKKLEESFPDLTVTEKRLCALLRLNLTTKEISILTLKGIAGIDVARYRLRKRLNLGREQSLQKFIIDL